MPLSMGSPPDTSMTAEVSVGYHYGKTLALLPRGLNRPGDQASGGGPRDDHRVAVSHSRRATTHRTRPMPRFMGRLFVIPCWIARDHGRSPATRRRPGRRARNRSLKRDLRQPLATQSDPGSGLPLRHLRHHRRGRRARQLRLPRRPRRHDEPQHLRGAARRHDDGAADPQVRRPRRLAGRALRRRRGRRPLRVARGRRLLRALRGDGGRGPGATDASYREFGHEWMTSPSRAARRAQCQRCVGGRDFTAASELPALEHLAGLA